MASKEDSLLSSIQQRLQQGANAYAERNKLIQSHQKILVIKLV